MGTSYKVASLWEDPSSKLKKLLTTWKQLESHNIAIWLTKAFAFVRSWLAFQLAWCMGEYSSCSITSNFITGWCNLHQLPTVYTDTINLHHTILRIGHGPYLLPSVFIHYERKQLTDVDDVAGAQQHVWADIRVKGMSAKLFMFSQLANKSNKEPPQNGY